MAKILDKNSAAPKSYWSILENFSGKNFLILSKKCS